MDYSFFKLNYLLYLQKKYWDTFKLAPKGIFILPPILKKQGLSHNLIFPAVKRDEENKISRPIAIIFVDKNGVEKSYDLNEYDFTNRSQNFDEKYTYHMEQQEYVKTTLETLIYSSNNSGKKRKEYVEEYFKKLQELFDKDFWDYYTDLQNNELTPITFEIKKERKKANPKKIAVLDAKFSELISKKKLKKEFATFVKQEILSDLKAKNTFLKLLFLNDFGNYLLNNNNIILETNEDLNTVKFEITKIYAKIICKEDYVLTTSLNFISKILIMMLNTLLISKINPEKKEKMEEEYQEYLIVFNKEIFSIKDYDSRNQIIEFTKQIKEYHDGKKTSIPYAYKYIFN